MVVLQLTPIKPQWKVQADSVTLNGTATRTEAIASHNDLLDIVQVIYKATYK